MKPHIHEDLTRATEVRGGSDRQFGVVVGLIVCVIALWPVLRHRPMRAWLLGAGAGLVLLGLIAPFVLRPLNRAWTLLGFALGRVMNPLIMAVLFYGVFTPIGALLRLMGKDALRLRADANAASYWVQRTPPGPPPESMANQF